MSVEVLGNPRPNPRGRRSKRGHFYTPSSADEWKQAIRDAVTTELERTRTPVTPRSPRPFSVDMVFRMPRPKNHWVARRPEGILRDDAPYWHINTPDADNLEKAVLDALGTFRKKSRILLADDSNVVRPTISKRYTRPGELPGLTLTIVELLDEDPAEEVLS